MKNQNMAHYKGKERDLAAIGEPIKELAGLAADTIQSIVRERDMIAWVQQDEWQTLVRTPNGRLVIRIEPNAYYGPIEAPGNETAKHNALQSKT